MTAAEHDLKRFLFTHMYRHEKVMGVWERARDAISRLFPAFLETPALMPPEWAALAAGPRRGGAGGGGRRLHRGHDRPLRAQ